MKNCIVNWFESVNDTDMDHLPNNIKWFFQFKWLSVCKPGNFVFTLASIYFSFYPVSNVVWKSSIETAGILDGVWQTQYVWAQCLSPFLCVWHRDWERWLVPVW